MTFAAKGSRTAFARAATGITPLLVGRPSPVWSGRVVRRTKACGGRTCFEIAETRRGDPQAHISLVGGSVVRSVPRVPRATPTSRWAYSQQMGKSSRSRGDQPGEACVRERFRT